MYDNEMFCPFDNRKNMATVQEWLTTSVDKY
jgi:hypothetical protein